MLSRQMKILSALIDIAIGTLKLKFFGIRTPLVLSISITSRCNLRCTYCYALEDNQRAKDMPLDFITDTLEEFYNLGTRVVMLQGGEPLLHRNLDEIVNYVKTKGMYCAITTNSLNFEKYIGILKKVDQVQLSIDGDRQITDKNRGKGVFDALVRAMHLCHENHIPFHLHTVVTNDSNIKNTLEPLTELVNRYRTYLNFCIPAPTGSALGKNLAANEHIYNFYKVILEMKKRGMPTNNTEFGLRDVIKWGVRHCYGDYIPVNSGNRDGYQKCIMGNLVCWLDSERNLFPCAIHFGQDSFSYSVKEHGVRGAWEKLKNIPCYYCANSTEFNNLFNFRLSSVFNSLKFLLRRQ